MGKGFVDKHRNGFYGEAEILEKGNPVIFAAVKNGVAGIKNIVGKLRYNIFPPRLSPNFTNN